MPTAKKPAYDPAKRYAVTLARAVEHEGFTLKPGPNPIEMQGGLVSALGAAVAAAHELPPAEPHPEAQRSVHEQAEI